MAEYIEREEAIQICQSYYERCLKMHDYCGDSVAYDIRANIQGLPTADVVEVVRCKDCEYLLFDTTYCKLHNRGYCKFDDTIKQPNHFCGYGTRKEGAEE